MASPTRTPPPPPAAEPIAPSSLSADHPPVKPSSDGSLSPENPAPAPPSPPATPPPHTPGDSSPSSTPHPSAPQPPPPPPPPPPLPPSADASPPLPPSADASPPLPRQGQTSPPRPLPPPSPAPISPPTPAPASSEAKSEQEAVESASESGSMTLAVVLAQTEDSTPRKASSAEASPTGSPQKESAFTIAKLLSSEDPAATEAKATPDKVTPPSDTGSLAAAAPAVTAVGGVGGGVGSKRWLLGGVPEKVRRAELRRAELGFRISAAVFCLVALSVMAADTTTGWSGDSFRRYNEYRYVLAASVMAFTYSGFQLVAEVHYLVTGKRMIQAPFRSYFNLAMDQMLAYLLLSASSAALSRNGVWMSRFGGDQFTKLINASASMAFLAFIALGLNSVISAYCIFSLVS